MKEPTLKIIPLRTAVSSDAPTTLDVVVRIVPPELETNIERAKLNIGLVIDRSGSMQGQKMEYARQAACYAVQQLLPTDRVSVIIYDDEVDVLVPSTLAENKAEIVSKIQHIHSRGTTALHAGWMEGGVQVSRHLRTDQLNRVILLSDGLANVGETNPDAIASDVKGLAGHGVSTTTMGIGNDYNEDLMEAMARSGDGNYYYIESPRQLPDIFQTELQGLLATIGQKVSLGIEPEEGVTVVDVLNDLDTTEYRRYKLSNLVVGNEINVVVRLKVQARKAEGALCAFRLAWNEAEKSGRQTLRVALQLPAVGSAQLSEFPANEEVQQLVAQLMSARAKEEVVRNLDCQDYAAAKQSLQEARKQVMQAPLSSATQKAMEALAALDLDLDRREFKKLRKKVSYQKYAQQRSRPEI